MPHINAAAALRICVLLSVLPAQYFISQWYGTDSAQCIQITGKFPEPEYIQISVGQVIGNKRFGYAGIIVGWDIKANSPEKWLQHKYPPANQGLKDSLSCGILINKANGFGKSTAYIPEEKIAIIMGLEVHHPDRKAYFSGYGGSKYIMQPWLGKKSSLMIDVLKCLYM